MYINQVKASRGRPVEVPDSLKNQPQLPFDLAQYLVAFFQLHSRRMHSMGTEIPIQVRDISEYAAIHGFKGEVKFFYRCMAECDTEYFKILGEKSSSKKGNSKSVRTKK